MGEYLINEFLYFAFPTIWPVLLFFVFGKNVYCFVKNRYYELGLYDPNVDEKTTGVSFLATIVFVFLSIFDITGLALLFEGVLVFGQQIANSVVAGGGLSEVMRIMISNGIILYALTQSGGGRRD